MSPRADRTEGAKGAATAARILETALALFREQGFDGTTMRDIARACDMSLGAAYYHFTSKEALLLAYYQQLHEDRLRHGAQLFEETGDLRARVVGLYHHHLAAFQDDRRLLAALVRIVADPESGASIFAPETRAIREADQRLFRRAIEVAEVSDDLRPLGALALWTLQLGLLLYLIWDESEDARQTHELVDRTVDLILPLVPLLATPLAAPLVGRIEATLEAAGLVADAVRYGEPRAPDE